MSEIIISKKVDARLKRNARMRNAYIAASVACGLIVSAVGAAAVNGIQVSPVKTHTASQGDIVMSASNLFQPAVTKQNEQIASLTP